MLLPIVLAAIVLLNLVSNYTFIHILLGTAVVCVLVTLVQRRRLSPPDSNSIARGYHRDGKQGIGRLHVEEEQLHAPKKKREKPALSAQ